MARRIILVDIGSGLKVTGVLPSVVLGADYAAKLTAIDGVPPYVFQLVAGVLPDGIDMDTFTGMFSGTAIAAGIFNFTVRVTDLSGTYVDRVCQIKVVAEPLTLVGDAPDGDQNSEYAYAYAASGGVLPYSWSSTVLPAGISLDQGGNLSGTPTVNGDFSWTITIVDAEGTEVTLDDGCTLTRYVDPVAESIYGKLVSWWPFDESAGTIAHDLHGGLDLNLTGKFSWGQTSIRTGGSPCIRWSTNTSKSVSASSPVHPREADDLSIFAWVALDSLAAGILIESYADGETLPTNVQYELAFDGSHRMYALWEYGGGINVQTLGPTMDLANHLIGFVKDGVAKTVTFSVDGINGSPVGFSSNPEGGTATVLCSGTQSSGGLQPLCRQQDQFLINGKLSSTEITWLYNGGSGRSYAELKNLAGH